MQINSQPSSTNFTAFKFANQKTANDFGNMLGELSIKNAKKALSIIDGQKGNKTNILIESIGEKVGLPVNDFFTGTVGKEEIYNTEFWGFLDFLKKCAKEADAQEVKSINKAIKAGKTTKIEARENLVQQALNSIDINA